MDEKLEISDFDIVGIIELKDVLGIEKYVTPKYENTGIGKPVSYFSRSKEYYNVKSLNELSEEREQLKKIVNLNKSKRNFVIIENMLNCSGKVYFKKFEDYIKNNKNNKLVKDIELAKKCMLEDVKNMIVLLSNEGTLQIDNDLKLPGGTENSLKRAIEMDNKAILYLFSKAFNLNNLDANEVQILNPGYGSLYIGPFLKEMYGYNFTNLLKSKYINETTGINEEKILNDIISNNEIYDKNKKVILLDDNVGTGMTVKEIKSLLTKNNISTYKSGAIQYNWRNYHKISIGEKEGIDRFNPAEFEILTPFNYAGHKLYAHAIDELHSSGMEYEKYLKLKSYKSEKMNDTQGSIIRGILSSKKVGLDLLEESFDNSADVKENLIDKYKNEKVNLLPESREFIKNILAIVKQIEKQEMPYGDFIEKGA